MNNLIPEPHADVNGKITTRWVRPMTQTPGRLLPTAPPVAPPPALVPVTDEEVPLLSSVLKYVFPTGRVEDMHPLAARMIEQRLVKAKGESMLNLDVLESEFIQSVYDSGATTQQCDYALSSSLVNNFAALGGATGESQSLLIAGLQEYSEFHKTYDFLLGLEPESQKRAQALYRVAASVGRKHLEVHTSEEDDEEYAGSEDDEYGDYAEDDNYYIKLANDGIARIVMDHPDRTEQIIALILERGSEDSKLIKDIIDNDDSPVLSEGML